MISFAASSLICQSTWVTIGWPVPWSIVTWRRIARAVSRTGTLPYRSSSRWMIRATRAITSPASRAASRSAITIFRSPMTVCSSSGRLVSPIPRTTCSR